MATTRPALLRPAGAVALATAVLLSSGCALLGGSDVKRDDSGAVVESADADVLALKVGDCLNTAALASEVSSVPAVPCSEPHDSVILSELTLTDAQGLPTAESTATNELIDTTCATAFEAWTPTTGERTDWSYNYFLPTQGSWDSGDRLVQCLAVRSAG